MTQPWSSTRAHTAYTNVKIKIYNYILLTGKLFVLPTGFLKVVLCLSYRNLHPAKRNLEAKSLQTEVTP